MKKSKTMAKQLLSGVCALCICIGVFAGLSMKSGAATVTLGSKPSGSVVKLKVNNVFRDFLIVQNGAPSAAYTGGDGVWLLQKDVYENKTWNSGNVPVYPGSDIDNYLNNEFLNLLDPSIKKVVKTVKLPCLGNGNFSAKVFLLSAYETGSTTAGILNPGPAPRTVASEGVKLSYFNSGDGADAKQKRVAYSNGSVVSWGLRTPVTNTSPNVFVHSIEWNGGCYGATTASSSVGVRPTLVLPASLYVLDDGSVVANTDPTISGNDGSLGNKSAGFDVSYQVFDTDGDTLSVTEKLNSTTLRTYSAAAGSSQSLSVSQTSLNALSVGSTNTLTITVSDGNGGTATRRHTFVAVDTTPPTAPTLSKSPTSVWHNGNVTVTLAHGTDSQSGVARSEYSFNNSSWSTYSSPFSVSASQTVYARTIDRSGNISTVPNISVKIDTVKPGAPTFTKSPAAEWHNGAVTLTINPGTDGQSGVARTEYSLNNSTWSAYSTPLIITTQQTVYARTFDVAGNVSTVSNISVKIDTVAPTAPKISKSPTALWHNDDVAISIASGTDTLSGVLRTEYSTDNKTWTSYTGTVTISASCTIYARTLDVAGNISTTDSLAVNIDVKNPTTPTLSRSPAAEWHNDSVNVSVTPGTDTGSGVLRTEYSTDNKKWEIYSAPVSIDKSCTVYARTLDVSGNISAVGSTQVQIDRTPPKAPEISKSPNDLWTNKTTTVSIRHGTDDDSGAMRTEYSTDNKKWETYSAPVSIDKSCTVYARTFDVAGNVSDVSNCAVNIDSVIPSSPTIDITPEAVDGWHLGGTSVTVKISHGTDEQSGVNRSEWSFNGADWQQYYSPFSAASDKTVYARTIDNTGNISSESEKDIKFDVTPPTEPTITRTPDVEYANSDVAVTIITGTDGESGIERTDYALGLSEKEAQWQPYEDPFTLAETSYIYIKTLDKVGNEVNKTELIKIDKDPPRVAEIAIKLVEGKRYVTVTAEDGSGLSSSGVKEIRVNGKVFSGDSATYLPVAGDMTAKIQVFDVAGNQSDIDERDVVPPEIISLTVNESFTAATIVAQDKNGSGVKGIWVDGEFFEGSEVIYEFDMNAPPYYLDVQAEDNDKNRSEVERFDVMAPTIIDMQVSGDFRTAVIKAADKGGSGVKGIWVDGEFFEGNPIVYDIPPGTTKISVYAEDGAGNKGAYNAKEYEIESPDKTPPKILNVSIDPTYTKVRIIAEDDFSGVKGISVNSAFYNGSPVTVELLAPEEVEDDSDGPTIGTSGLTIGASGIPSKSGSRKSTSNSPLVSRSESIPPVMLEMQAEDYAGNKSDILIQDVRRPIISNIKINDDHSSVTITGYDEGGSELKYIYIDGQAYTDSPVTYQLKPNTTVLKIYAEDGDGNLSEIVDLDVTQRDILPPAIESVRFKENGSVAEIIASDEGGSGLKGVFINGKLFDGGMISYEIPDKTKNLLIQAIDNAGNLSKTIDLDITEPDRVPPTIDSVIFNEKGDSVEITASDIGSGVKGVLVDGNLYAGNKTTYSVPVGTTKLLIQAIDNAGNKSSELSKDVPIAPPTSPPPQPPAVNEKKGNIKISITPPEGWKNSKAKIKITVKDDSYDITTIEAKIDNGDWNDITNDPYLDITENGTVYINAENENGDTAKKSQSINCFDKESPAISAKQEGGIISITANDNLSGISSITTNDIVTRVEEKTSAFSESPDRFEFDYEIPTEKTPDKVLIYATDRAGNKSKRKEIKVDKDLVTSTDSSKSSTAQKPQNETSPQSGTPSASGDPQTSASGDPQSGVGAEIPVQVGDGKTAYIIIGDPDEPQMLYTTTTTYYQPYIQIPTGATADDAKKAQELTDSLKPFLTSNHDENGVLTGAEQYSIPDPSPTPTPSPSPTVAPTPTQTPSPSPAPQKDFIKDPSPAVTTNPSPQPLKKQENQDKNPAALIIAAISLLVIGLIVMAIWWFKKRQQNKSKIENMDFDDSQDENGSSEDEFHSTDFNSDDMSE